MFEVKKIKDFIGKEQCRCNQLAVYYYAPDYKGKEKEEELNYYCEDCVPRGCSCNNVYVDEEGSPTGIEGVDWKWVLSPADKYNAEVKAGEVWVNLDENGREGVCCEFWYSKEGFDKL